MVRLYCPDCGSCHDKESVSHELLESGYERGVLDIGSEVIDTRDELIDAQKEVERLTAALNELLDADQNLWGYDNETRDGIFAGRWN
tara:strand:- start:886 stop:1146 length:261 start_codon:yes stop_codon:yes gene_type:complete